MSQTNIKRIFIAFFIFLPLQYAAVGIIGLIKSEPYPALVLPAFQHIDATPRYVFTEKPVFSIVDVNGELHEDIKADRLFNGILESQLQGFMKVHFSDSAYWAGIKGTSKKWLRNQIQKNYPRIEAGDLIISWQKTYYNLTDAKLRVDSIRTVNEFSIPL